ncbi:methionyl-tRNA formyltransferase [Paenibacillus naphthalenovorans]|uniref:Methionyl-tRNA formyltransferase n=1 Tax=Paenibacillus naphthalenovorans TaxID=162209 RepID=A0A0U2W220_9BACL|nr:methionyl-tRNA formyltransferase [Paenibacillus naphthalenovorans]ALS21557.1 methionyl-tRNA formyltransferase [Paenibacillus naphthalenovorans]
MRVIFMGTPEFAVPSLQTLLEYDGVEVVAVVTQPDRPVGRKRILTPTPVKAEAEKHGIPVLQPERLRSPESVDALSALQPELIVTAAYGQILPKSVLDLPRLGCINIHASLLPKYRGGAPIHYAVMNGDPVTGVTIMYMAEGLDTGDMISRIEVPIGDQDTTGTMFEKLSIAGAKLLKETLPDLLSGRVRAVPQNDEEAVYSPNISREQERIDWTKPALQIWNLVRALHPRPGAFTLWNGDVLKIWTCAKPDAAESVPGSTLPGTVLEAGERGIAVATGQGVLRITELQPAGKKAMDAAAFARGGQLTPGTVLGI